MKDIALQLRKSSEKYFKDLFEGDIFYINNEENMQMIDDLKRIGGNGSRFISSIPLYIKVAALHFDRVSDCGYATELSNGFVMPITFNTEIVPVETELTAYINKKET